MKDNLLVCKRGFSGKIIARKIVIGSVVWMIVFWGTFFHPAWAQERAAVKSAIANLRSGPGTKYEVLWQVEQYHPFLVVEKKGSWYKVKDFESDMAWVHKSLLGDFKSVITTRPKSNVREEPSTKSKIVFTVERGVPFREVKRKGQWINIRHADGETGWIFHSLVW